MTGRTRVLGVAIPAAAIALIGWVDYVTGPDIGFSLFYLIPIAFVGWHAGIRAAMAMAIVASAAWLAADLFWRRGDNTAVAISLWNAFTRLVIYTSEGVFIAVLRRDREVMRRMVAREAALARTDALTSLPNSRAFLELVESELTRGAAVSLLYLDLDNFKLLNDRFGHRVGNDVLAEVAAALRSVAPDGAVAARIGGDEFALLLRDDDACAIADTIARRVREIGAAKGEPSLGATVGIAYARSGATAEDLLHAADLAMYEGKERAKGSVIVADQNA